MNYTQLYINDQEVDLSGVDKVSLIFAINDIRELSNRDSDRSRTIEIPGTKTNHIIFGHAFNINSTGSFDATTQATALLKVNGIIQMEGFARLMRCEQNGLMQTFSLNIFAGNLDWVSAIGEAELTDLDLSDYDHVWNGTNIRGSWVNTSGYVYPLIEYGKFGTYQTTDNVNDYDMYPAVFVKDIVEKIFERIDYQLSGSFFADPIHKALILPFANKNFEHSQEWKDERDFAGVNATTQTYTAGAAYTVISYTTVTGNTAAYYNNTTNRFTAVEALQISLNIDALVSGGAGGATLHIEIYKNNAATGVELTHTNPATPTGNYPIQGDLSIDLAAGDYIDLRFGGTTGGGGTTSMQVVSITTTSDVKRVLIPGGKVRIHDTLPKFKQIDLVKALFKMFGIIFQTDVNAKTVQWDTFTQFYKKPDASNPDSFADWSNKLDLTGKIEHEFIIQGYGRNNLFKYKQDLDDADIVEYMRTRAYPYSTGFGNGSHSIDNDFLKPEEVIADLPFASTWMADSFNSKLHLPQIIRLIDNEYNGTPEPRILIYAGSVSVETLTGDANYLSLNIDNTTVTNIGYAYYWKKAYGDTVLDGFDVNLYFDNEAVQYGTTLLEKYYPDLLNLIANSKLIKCWVTLNEVDIANLDFGKAIYISYFRSYFILNKINDYYANQNYESCQAELLPLG